MTGPFNVLFLCTANSARSILAESILNDIGRGRYQAFSAGSFPRGSVHPEALRLLAELGHPIEGLRSKSWDEFAGPKAPPLHFIFTVCDNAAGEICPIWPGKPTTAHWGIPDPASSSPEDQPAAFRKAFERLKDRIQLFLSLPYQGLDEDTLRQRLREIGASAAARDND